METLELARWQFAATTVYHFLFVPLTIGLSVLVAGMQTAWYRTDNPVYLRMTKFWGKLLLINFAIGVATGIVQEFQFGMAWSGYSRYVGDIFGAPLAIEGLVAFFLESTFLGLWIFGWKHLPKKLHLMSAWCFAIGTWLSAYFILAANSWMQHPVGYRINDVTDRAELTSISEVLTNSTALFAFSHTVLGALATAASIIIGVSGWHLYRMRRTGVSREEAGKLDRVDAAEAANSDGVQMTPAIRRGVFMKSMKLGLITMFVAVSATMLVGHFDAQLMTKQQPMKMAAAEALYETTQKAEFSLFTVGPLSKKPEEHQTHTFGIPGLTSFLATNSFNGTVKGINQIQAEEEAKYGPGEYYPIIGLTYWSFRLMMGAGIYMAMLSLAGLVLLKRRVYEKRWFKNAGLLGIFAGFGAHAFGWMFTEVGRQPWVVYGLQKTSDGVSRLAPSTVAFSLIVFTLLYGALAVVMYRLFVRYAQKGPEADVLDEQGMPQLAIHY
ncbi:MAG: cytochrome ubiquinol oxidase subunit I [Solirubrobacteraceae bacterium]|nr:cytochrome ubiquinol oxidase subunit I [Solirubrobacteraceae bacterium]